MFYFKHYYYIYVRRKIKRNVIIFETVQIENAAAHEAILPFKFVFFNSHVLLLNFLDLLINF